MTVAVLVNVLQIDAKLHNFKKHGVSNNGDVFIHSNLSNVDNVIQDITNELHKVISWFNTNKLHLNANKSTFIIFHTNQEQ